MPSIEHEELVKKFCDELGRCGWRQLTNAYREAGPINLGMADAMFSKDGRFLALEVGFMYSEKFQKVVREVKAGKFDLLCVSFEGDIELIDSTWCPRDNLTCSCEEPAKLLSQFRIFQ